jgi:hypothetical protein
MRRGRPKTERGRGSCSVHVRLSRDEFRDLGHWAVWAGRTLAEEIRHRVFVAEPLARRALEVLGARRSTKRVLTLDREAEQTDCQKSEK